MIRAALFLVAFATTANAQSFDEAVRGNTALATSLCVDAMLGGIPPETVFTPAGFVYRGVDRGTNEFGVVLGLDHYFDAPADTAKAEVANIGRPPGLCTVMSTHLSQAELSALVANVLYQKHPATQTGGPNQWTIRLGARLPLIVSVTTIGNHKYEAPGTVRVSMSFPG